MKLIFNIGYALEDAFFHTNRGGKEDNDIWSAIFQEYEQDPIHGKLQDRLLILDKEGEPVDCKKMEYKKL